MDATELSGNTEPINDSATAMESLLPPYSWAQDEVLQDSAKGQLVEKNMGSTNCVSNTNTTNMDAQVLPSQQVAIFL